MLKNVPSIIPVRHRTCIMDCNPVMSGALYWFVRHYLEGNHGNRCFSNHVRHVHAPWIRGGFLGARANGDAVRMRIPMAPPFPAGKGGDKQIWFDFHTALVIAGPVAAEKPVKMGVTPLQRTYTLPMPKHRSRCPRISNHFFSTQISGFIIMPIMMLIFLH